MGKTGTGKSTLIERARGYGALTHRPYAHGKITSF
jgi:ABC-type lipoprotein export system ATPase subunit